MAYIDPDTGQAHSYPNTKERAIALKSHLYNEDGAVCPDCKAAGRYHIDPIRYVSTDQCLKCIVEGVDGYEVQRHIIDWSKYTLRPHGCKGGPHLLMYHRGTKRCVTCEKPTPRQIAQAAGETWYMPDNYCKRCNTQSLKRVNDGRCKGCTPPKVKEANPLPADTIMDRVTARSLGFKHYRTGAYCKRGHTGFRYVSTSQCCECLASLP